MIDFFSKQKNDNGHNVVTCKTSDIILQQDLVDAANLPPGEALT
jgi:hypothetical protein